MRQLVEHIEALGALQDGLNVPRATDVMHALDSHETYLELVQRSGWDLLSFKAWLFNSLCRLLLRGDPAADSSEETALAGLTYSDLATGS